MGAAVGLEPRVQFRNKYKLCLWLFQIAPRAQNAVAYVNGGFKINLNKKDRLRILGTPTILFGGISPSFVSVTLLNQQES